MPHHEPHCVCDYCVRKWRAFITRRDADMARQDAARRAARSSATVYADLAYASPAEQRKADAAEHASRNRR